MREEQWVLMDNLKRKIFVKHEIKQILYKSVLKNNRIFNVYRYHASYLRAKTQRWGTVSQQINRCSFSGRSWSVHKKTRYSRFVFRQKAYTGDLPGFNRASW